MKKTTDKTYFKALNLSLKNYKRAIPCLLIDLDRLDTNINTLKATLPTAINFRLVVKSLPSYNLIDYILKKTSTHKLMVFHQPFLTDLTSKLNEKHDVLIGKPMPIKTAEYYYNNLPKNSTSFNPYQQIQWLVDSEQRIQEYIDLAKKLNQKLHLNIEIDVGLHRGGFMTLNALRNALSIMSLSSKYIEFSGLMGYDPHVVKLPSIIRSKEKALQLANTFYQGCKNLIKKEFSSLWSNTLTFNGSGSPTLNLHTSNNSPLNDISVGSCLVKPTTFNIPSLKKYQAACYIATPVLKKFKGTTLPALEKFKNLLSFINSKNKISYFIYGGYWKADYCYPFEIRENDLFGTSTNQTMVNTSKKNILEIDDFVFLQPQQSEFVFLQFGELLPIRKNNIQQPWQLLKNN
ncbi:alanine racemase [Tenacibaculum ovolyticum]|uniref:alanine racemase n=1 Tax=Tenacibaculum ovolyticum TaxID=104270 RepID=UPI001F34A855|nr:alanine racemase [Tenacibaculum ovolyticum]